MRVAPTERRRSLRSVYLRGSVSAGPDAERSQECASLTVARAEHAGATRTCWTGPRAAARSRGERAYFGSPRPLFKSWGEFRCGAERAWRAVITKRALCRSRHCVGRPAVGGRGRQTVLGGDGRVPVPAFQCRRKSWCVEALNASRAA